MFSLRSKSRVAVFLTLLVVAWTVVGGLDLAAQEGEMMGEGEYSGGEESMGSEPAGDTMTDTAAAAESMKGPVWAVAYIVVLLLIGLGVFATVRGSGRRDRAKPEDYASAAK